MSDGPDQPSLRLCQVLERIGVTESMRKISRDTSFYRELSQTICNRMVGSTISTYIFGSSCEATTTPDMGSDLDVVMVNERLPVIEDIGEAPPGDSLLMITDKNTRPGYIKLQKVLDGMPLTIHNCGIDVADTDLQYDCEGRVCKKHYISQLEYVDEINGPANSISNNRNVRPTDFVSGYRCKTFPQAAVDSMEKCVECGWMSKVDEENLKKLGVLIVGVGHPASEERELEWRISFSLQERHMMLALSPVQHRCYVLLKVIKNLLTDNVGKSITSYHCKTSLFTVITTKRLEIWTEENLIECVLICLAELQNWVSNGCCPNFFIKQNNMFERRICGDVQERLLHHLSGILSQGPDLFYTIKAEHIGESMRGMAGKHIDQKRREHLYNTVFRICERNCRFQMQILQYCHELPSSQDINQYLSQQLTWLTSIDKINEHTQEETQMVVKQLEPLMHKLSAQHLAAMAFTTEDIVSRHRLLKTSAYHSRLGANHDAMSGRLLEATILYKEGNMESCRSLLKQIEGHMLTEAVESLCKCYQQKHSSTDYLKRKISRRIINDKNIMELAMAPCIIFLPSQSEIIPKALQYEMYRSVNAQPESRDKYFMEWYDWAVVDAPVYLYFMQYLVYQALNQPVGKQLAIDQIFKTLLQGENLGHKETGYNLLSWIYIQERQLLKAYACLCLSFNIRQYHNAAKWHLPELYRTDVANL